MYTEVVSSEMQYLLACDNADKDGYRVGCISNAGLKHPHWRITFIDKDIWSAKAA